MIFSGAPTRTRTWNLPLRRRLHYPVVLWAQRVCGREYGINHRGYSTISRPWQSLPGIGFSVQICSSCMIAVTAAISRQLICIELGSESVVATSTRIVVIDKQ